MIGSQEIQVTGGQGVSERRVEPSTQAALLSVCASVFGKPVALEDDFFSLGGDSLMAMELTGRLRQQGFSAVSIRDVFRTPKFADLMLAIEPTLDPREAARGHLPAFADGRAPANPTQRHWLRVIAASEEQGLPVHPFSCSAAYVLRGQLDGDRLLEACAALVERHEALRTSFVQEGDATLETVDSEAHLVTSRVSLRNRPVDQAREDAITLAKKMGSRQFDLSDPPLLRTLLVDLARDEHLFAVTVSHLVCDGWSFTQMFEEIAAHYEGNGGSLNTEPAGAWPSFLCASAAVDESDVLFAQHSLPDAGRIPHVEFDGARPRPGKPSLAPAELQTMVTAARLKSLCKACGATPNAGLFALVSILVSTRTDRAWNQIRTQTANRLDQERFELFGYVTNQVGVAIDGRDDPTFEEYLARTADMLAQSLDRCHIPYWGLVERLDPAQFGNPVGKSTVKVEYLQPRVGSKTLLRLAGIESSEIEIHPPIFQPVTLFQFRDAGDSFGLSLRYEADCYSGSAASTVVGSFTRLLDAAVARPTARLADLQGSVTR